MPICINKTKDKYKYSICTLVTNLDEYNKMLDSFKLKGFDSTNSEFLYIDNTRKNVFDGYSGINHFLSNSNARYVIVCHQDCILSNDDESKLSQCIDELYRIDKLWSLAGNAGGIDLSNIAVRITDPGGISNTKNLPIKVTNLDENFILINKKRRVCLSGDLDGFHLYGTDICKIANILGYSAYVIDFHLTHNGVGNINHSFRQCKINLINKYQKSLKGQFIRTTCTKMYLSSNKFFNFILNKKRVLNLVKLLGFK